MKIAKLIYNPNSGDGAFKHYLDDVVHILQNNGDGYVISLFRTIEGDCLVKRVASFKKYAYDLIIVCGGDGTINQVVNGIVKSNFFCNLGIIPSGTSNDLARFLHLPSSPVDCAKLIIEGNSINIDIGLANEQYFINVLAIGSFASVSHNVDKTLKSTFGKLSYYLKAIESFPSLKAIPLKITQGNSKQKIHIGKFYLVTILNSTGAGGFDKLAPYGNIADGKFDFIGFKTTSSLVLAKTFFDVLLGKHLRNSKDVIFFQEEYIKIELDDNYFKEDFSSYTDVDGEDGPNFPIEFEVIKNRLKVFVPVK